MNTDRMHRMTELFGRLAPGATLEAARAELTSVHEAILREHPDAYSAQAQVQLQVRTLRDQLASPARNVLLVLLAAAAVVFVIACSNVANLILARSVRREAELNAFVFSAFGGIALLIAVVGVAGVLAFSVSARTREFGVRLAIGSTPRDLRDGVLWDGTQIAAIGIAAGAVGGSVLVHVAQGLFGNVQLPGALVVVGAAVVLITAAILASLMPATRASRVDVLQALRSE